MKTPTAAGRAVLRALVVAVVLAAAPGTVSAAMHEVPLDCGTIQECVDRAVPGDTVYVHSGTYHEHVTLSKRLVLLGEDRETTVIDGDGAGTLIHVGTADVVVAGFTVRNGTSGVYCQGAARSDISNCMAIHNLYNGIRLIGSPNSRVSDCEISDTYGTEPFKGYALFLNGSPNCHIERVRISGSACHRAFVPYHSSGTVVRDMELFDHAGFAVVAGFGSYDMARLYIHDTSHGIQFNGASGGRLADSVLRSITSHAIHMQYHSRGNVIEGNVIEANGWGVGWGYPGVQENRFYHNDFIDNTVQLADAPSGYPGAAAEIWDDGYPSGGNYWSDYSGVDLMSGPGQDIPGSDGIGDTPHWLKPRAADGYPLMVRWNPLEAGLDFDPDVVNCHGGGLVTCYIELPEGWDPADIEVASVKLNEALAALPAPTTVGDHDLDGRPDLMVKLSRGAVAALLPEGQDVEVAVSGELTCGTRFTCSDRIRVICNQ